MEVDEEPSLDVGESQITKKLSLMNRGKLLNCLHFHDYFAVVLGGLGG